MLLQHLGKEPFLAGVQDFIARYRDNADHPILQDILDALRERASDKEAYDELTDQWFREVVLPEYRLTEARVEPSGEIWTVAAHVENRGSGRMPVCIAAESGQRFQEGGLVHPSFQEARKVLWVEPGAGVEFRIECPFAPARLVVDPDAIVLQKGRRRARLDL